MPRVIRTKLLLPAAAGLLPRPRLLDCGPPPRILVLQAPAGAGKSSFLAQWLPQTGIPCIYYSLDGQDREAGHFAAHIGAGLQRAWPDWDPPEEAATDPAELAAELAGEAAGRPPLTLALDGLEAAFGQPWLADFLAVLVRYAPPALHLALSTRAPLPVEPGADCRILRAADLAFTPAEAEALMGPRAGWAEAHQLSGGLPLALELWRRHGPGWRTSLTAQMLGALPPYIEPEIARGLVAQWLAGNLSLEAFAHQVSVGQPGAEQLWLDIGEIHMLFADHPPSARERADALWEIARGRGDRQLMAITAQLQGEITMAMGEYALAADWYRQAFDIDPMLELTGSHSKALLLRDQGRLDEAESLACRCVEARAGRGDLVATAMGHVNYGMIMLARERWDEAEAHLLEAEALYHKFAANTPLGATAICQRSLVEAARGNMAAFRRLAEEAYGMMRGRFRFLEACTGMVLAAALMAWGDRSTAEWLLTSSYAYLASIGSKFYLHNLLTIFARKSWAEGRPDEARRQFDEALGYAAREGYLHYLTTPRTQSLPLIIDALGRGVEAPFCQELLVRMGARALPALLEMAGSGEAPLRRAALYPLTALGTPEATEAVRRLLRDPDPTVRDSALLAYQSLVRTAEAPATEVPAQTRARLSLSILGPLEVLVEGRPLPKWRTVKARDLLAYFVLAGERPVTRDQVIEALWPELEFDAARTLLHTTLYNLRNSLGAVGDGLITFAGGAYRMARDGVEIDLTRFERLADAADETAWQTAATLYRGDLAEGLDYPWLEGPRTHARRLYQATLRKLAERRRSGGQQTEALETLQLLIQVDPLDEEAHLGLMETYAALGNRSAALQQYRTIARLLDDELGLEPGPRTQALYRKLLD